MRVDEIKSRCWKNHGWHLSQSHAGKARQSFVQRVQTHTHLHWREQSGKSFSDTLWIWSAAVLQVVRSIFWHALERLRMISTNLPAKKFLVMLCWVAFALLMVPWPLKLIRSKSVGSQEHFLFTPLAAVHVFGWDKNSFGDYSYLCSGLWQAEETPLLKLAMVGPR